MTLTKKKSVFLMLLLMFIFSCKVELITLPKPSIGASSIMLKEKIFPINNSIEFSGYRWIVSNSPDKKVAPGNNYWSSSAVWIDGLGNLHLLLKKDPETNKWFCAEIKSEKKFGYGLYKFWVQGRLDKLNKNVVFGLFNYSGVDFFDEIDIEFSRWGNEGNKNLHYTVYPAENANTKTWGASKELTLKDEFSLHQFTRSKSNVKFESFYDFQSGKAHSKKYSSTAISKKEMPLYINLWAFKNMPPSDEREVEIVIQKFEFIE